MRGGGTAVWRGWNDEWYVRTDTAGTTTSDSSEIWRVWNRQVTGTTASAVWVAETTASLTSSSAITWRVWNREWDAYEDAYAQHQAVRSPEPSRRPPSPAELAERQRQADIAAKLKAEHDARMAAANACAEKLLRSGLSREQIACLEARGFFYVTGADGHVYKIKRGSHGNVERVDPTSLERSIERLCAAPQGGVPDADAMLAQKLMLECNAAAYRTVANKTQLTGV